MRNHHSRILRGAPTPSSARSALRARGRRAASREFRVSTFYSCIISTVRYSCTVVCTTVHTVHCTPSVNHNATGPNGATLQSAVKKAGLGFGIGPVGRPIQGPQLVHVIDGGRQDEEDDEVGAASVQKKSVNERRTDGAGLKFLRILRIVLQLNKSLF